jgi:anthranilate phosphoribosyltransferase
VGLTLEELGGWPEVLGRLFLRQELSEQLAGAALAEILTGVATPAQIGAFVAGLRTKGETVAEMLGLVRAMQAHAEPVPVPPGAELVDTCGTGGDRSGSINVSTIAAFVVAGAGARVCKHGGRAASSMAGSADVLEALGVVIDLGPTGVVACIERAGIGFCFAPRFHPAMRHAGPVRRELGVPTVFNFLGPLANPARARRQVVGVSDPTMARTMLGVLVANGARHAMVVHGADGLDELSTTGPSEVLVYDEAVDGSLAAAGWTDWSPRRLVIEPASLGLAPATVADLRGGDPATNATMVRRVLAGEPGPCRDIVLLNAAAGLVVAGAVADLGEGVTRAAAAIDDGRAGALLDRLVQVSQAARAEEA